MAHNLTLNPRRLGLLLKKEVLFENKKLLIGLGGTFVLLTLIIFSSYIDGGNNGHKFFVHDFYYKFILIGGGLLYTSTIFNELNNKLERASYLSIPASHLEKFTSKWIQTFIGFPIVFTLLYLVFSYIIYFVSTSFSESHIMPLEIFSSSNSGYRNWVWVSIKSYLAAQSLFLLAAIAFRKFEFFKLFIVLFGLLIGFSFFAAIVFRIVFADFFSGAFMANETINIMPHESFEEFIEGPFSTLLNIIVSFGLPIFFWFVGYLKLTEKEA